MLVPFLAAWGFIYIHEYIYRICIYFELGCRENKWLGDAHPRWPVAFFYPLIRSFRPFFLFFIFFLLKFPVCRIEKEGFYRVDEGGYILLFFFVEFLKIKRVRISFRSCWWGVAVNFARHNDNITRWNTTKKKCYSSGYSFFFFVEENFWKL